MFHLLSLTNKVQVWFHSVLFGGSLLYNSWKNAILPYLKSIFEGTYGFSAKGAFAPNTPSLCSHYAPEHDENISEYYNIINASTNIIESLQYSYQSFDKSDEDEDDDVNNSEIQTTDTDLAEDGYVDVDVVDLDVDVKK